MKHFSEIIKMKLLYLSGPMTGIADQNRQAFNDAENRLRCMGFGVMNPHDFPPPDLKEIDSYDEYWAEFLARDVWILARANRPDAVVLLPGWRSSKGSLLEAAVAKRFDIPVYTYGQVLKGELKP